MTNPFKRLSELENKFARLEKDLNSPEEKKTEVRNWYDRILSLSFNDFEGHYVTANRVKSIEDKLEMLVTHLGLQVQDQKVIPKKLVKKPIKAAKKEQS